MTFRRIGRHFVFALSACLLFVSVAVAQQDVERNIAARVDTPSFGNVACR